MISMAKELTEERREQLMAGLEAAGLSAVQMALSNPGTSPLFGRPVEEGITRQMATEWVADELKLDRRRRRRNDALLIIATGAAVIGAVTGLYLVL